MPAPLTVAFALPDDPALDAFCSGDAEVDAYFRSRRWFNPEKALAAPPTYAFHFAPGGPLVGLAAIAFRNAPHPTDDSPRRAKVLMVYALGVGQPFQGQPNPLAPHQTAAASIIDILHGFAAAKEGCLGLALWIRSTNQRALRFYEKMGFTPDPAGPVRRDDGPPHWTMRRGLG